MPISLQKVRDTVRTISVEYADENADVTFYPHRVTKSLLREVTDSKGDGIDRLAVQLSKLVVAWDVLGDDGKPVPPTVEAMAEFPIDFLTAVMKGINEAMTVGEG